MRVGMMIRTFRLNKGLSQGEIEKRTGLLRCYLSRVENGHTVPSLETLNKIARALEVPLSRFFDDDPIDREMPGKPLSDDELRFLIQVRRYSSGLNETDRRLLLAMVRKFSSTPITPTAPAYSTQEQ